jgi:hypothetical protein
VVTKETDLNRTVTLTGGPLDGLDITTSTNEIKTLGTGYSIWTYSPNPKHPNGPWTCTVTPGLLRLGN